FFSYDTPFRRAGAIRTTNFPSVTLFVIFKMHPQTAVITLLCCIFQLFKAFCSCQCTKPPGNYRILGAKSPLLLKNCTMSRAKIRFIGALAIGTWYTNHMKSLKLSKKQMDIIVLIFLAVAVLAVSLILA